MELSLYLDILKRRWLIIVAATFMAVLVVALAGFVATPTYRAYTTVRIVGNFGIRDFTISRDSYDRLIKTYGQIVRSSPILKQAISSLDMPTSSRELSELRDEITAETIPGTELFVISVAHTDPLFAQAMANELARLLVEYVKKLYSGVNANSSQIESTLSELEMDIEQNREVLMALMSEDQVDEVAIERIKNDIAFKEDTYSRMLLLYHNTRLNEELQAKSVVIVTPAPLPTEPTNKFGFKELGLGLIVGLFSGISLALVMENLDTRIYSVQQLEGIANNLPTLGVIPEGILRLDELGNNAAKRDYHLLEAYRLLAINLQMFRKQNPMRTIMVSSPVSQEGKSTVALNLSRVFAERGQTTFLVEADMRRPSLGENLGDSTGEGLSDLLSEAGSLNQDQLSQVLLVTEQPNLFFVGGGEPVSNPTPLLTSLRMTDLLEYLGEQGQITMVDAPPVLGIADVSLIASHVDGVILVISLGFSRKEELLATLKQLQLTQTNILGVVCVKAGGEKKYFYG